MRLTVCSSTRRASVSYRTALTSPSRHARPGDAVIVSGTIGDHGVTVLSQRQGLHFRSPVKSDVAPLSGLAWAMLDAASSAVHAMRDPTRGGLATTLKEIAAGSSVGIEIEEDLHTRLGGGRSGLRDARPRLPIPRERREARGGGGGRPMPAGSSKR